MTKGSKAVKSREAGESLEKAKAEFSKSAQQPAKKSGRLPPKPGESIVEPVKPAKRPKKSKLKKIPKVTTVDDRRNQAYTITKSSAEFQGNIDSGDTSKIEEVVSWRVVSDKSVMIGGFSVNMRAGAVVNRLTHDLDNLRSMGVVLEMVNQ